MRLRGRPDGEAQEIKTIADFIRESKLGWRVE
jgi:hypothetical protein